MLTRSPRPARPPIRSNLEEMTTEEFCREIIAEAEGKARQPLRLGPRPGLEPPALPARFRRVRGGDRLVSYELLVGGDGRIAAKHENVSGTETYHIYEYDAEGHLLRAWRNGRLAEEYAYDPQGARIAAWSPQRGQWAFAYDRGGRLASAGPWGFHYAGSGRLPRAATVQTAQGAASYLLGYDQAGSLKAVAAMDGPREGRVVKVVDYDAFGQILSDSNPGLFMPLAFAGGLRDKFTGLVRFLHRDYDPTIGRFTAPDPLGDTGGDHDLYDYCVDDPVGRVDPEGLFFSNLWSLLGFADENKKQEKREETARNAWEEAGEAAKSGDVGKAMDIYESMPDIITNSTAGGGGKVGAAGIRVILNSKPWGKATPSR